MTFRVKFSCVFDGEFLSIFFCFVLNALPPLLAPLRYVFDVFAAFFGVLFLIVKLQRVVPFVFIEIQQHFLLQLVRTVVYVDRIIVFVQALVHSLY